MKVEPGTFCAFRVYRDWTIERFADALGLSRAQTINIEQGHFETRRLHILALIGLASLTELAPFDHRKASDVPTDSALLKHLAQVGPAPGSLKPREHEWYSRTRGEEIARHIEGIAKRKKEKQRWKKAAAKSRAKYGATPKL